MNIKQALGGALFAAAVVVQPADAGPTADHLTQDEPTCNQMTVVLPLVSPLPLEDELAVSALIIGFGKVYSLPLVAFEVNYEDETAWVVYADCV